MNKKEKDDMLNIFIHIKYSLDTISKIVDPNYETDVDGDGLEKWIKQLDQSNEIIEKITETFGEEEEDDGKEEGREDDTEEKTKTETEA